MADNNTSQTLYDVTKTYYENLEQGPFGRFADNQTYQNEGEPQYDFFGTPVYLPFGIAAGPLPNFKFVQAAFNKGFDVVTFKSVRTHEYPCHPAPNIVALKFDGQLDPLDADKPIVTSSSYVMPLTMANSYGIPSFEPEVWQPEMKKAFGVVGKGQAMLVAFQGTDRGEGREAFIKDHVEGIKLLKETGANVIEINLSCPNEGSKELLCFDIDTTKQILEAVRAEVADVKLLVKIAYFTDTLKLKEFVSQIGPLVDGISAINTVAARVVDEAGEQAFSGGAARMKPGVSGHAILDAGLEMVGQLARYRDELELGYKIVGIGGVQSAGDFLAYRDKGADIVLSVTGAMWNPKLAQEIKAQV